MLHKFIVEGEYMKIEWKNLYRGVIMGISDLVPGVSGGTMAFILGIYEQLINSINRFFSRDWYKQIPFLLPLGIGMVSAIFAFSNLMEYLMENYLQPTSFLFIGLIFGIIPMLLKTADIKNNFSKKHYVLVIIAFILVASMAPFKDGTEAVIINELTFSTFLLLFFSGWIASMALLLPGISGSLVLLVIGTYASAVSAISNFNFPIIFTLGAGIVLGFILCSKIVRYLLQHYAVATFAVIIGLVLGSAVVVFPGISSNIVMNFISILTFIIGFFFVQIIGRKNDMKI